MAKSKAKKKREHDVRNGRSDKTLLRGGEFVDISTHVRKTPTKIEKVRRMENKYKRKLGDFAS